ncbi:1612_t:CDS:1 [Paraglomus brasilianum]|uniref:1612_t:CDS:1 n=1 Tax=Paraglomus brasilianum TaxID=144538 RepID=A0A9N9DVQ4_9GLOM|nr:1612_t:CDS:1 [Paraglomus brasilianum]
MYEQYRGSAWQKSRENTKLTLQTDRTSTEQTDVKGLATTVTR